MTAKQGDRRKDHSPHKRRIRFQMFVSAEERDFIRRIAIARGVDASTVIRALVAEEFKLLQLGGRTPYRNARDIRDDDLDIAPPTFDPRLDNG